MNQYLPYGGFEWLKNIDKFDIMSINEFNSIDKKSNGIFFRS